MFHKLSFVIVLISITLVSFHASAQLSLELPIQIDANEFPRYTFEDGALLLRYACEFGHVDEACQKLNQTVAIPPSFEDGALLLRYACEFGHVDEACQKLNGK